MKDIETLYNNIPPSKLINREEAFIPTDLSLFWCMIFDFIFLGMLDKNFTAIRIKNLDKLQILDKTKGCLVYSNHNCWWDGIVSYYLCRKIFNTRLHIMTEELHRLPLLSKIGGFSVSKYSAHSVLKSLKYSVNILKNPQNTVWIYPQGIIKPPDHRPILFESGISYICQKLPKINLLPIAFKYDFLRGNKPDILIEIGDPLILNGEKIERQNFNRFLEQNFEIFLNNQHKAVSEGNLTGYKTVFKAKLSLFSKKLKIF